MREKIKQLCSHDKELINQIEGIKAALEQYRNAGIGDGIESYKELVSKTSSYGLRNIAERAVEIGCTYKIVSVPNEGSIVEVKVPLKKEEHMDD